MEFGTSYNGYTYVPSVESDDDMSWFIHEVKTPDGKTIEFHYPRLKRPPLGIFCYWIELGCPDGIWTDEGIMGLVMKKTLGILSELPKTT